MTQTGRIVIDTSFLMGLLDLQDIWHKPATELHKSLKKQNFELVFFDCVLAETISILSRRIHEKRRTADLDDLIDIILTEYPIQDATWILPEAPHLYEQVVDLVRKSDGELNFNDALIALVCRDNNIPLLASFDRDFDNVSWLQRIANPSDLENGDE
ncbi:MAG: type II toxin-antitoxin system VapC family toxin [Chloroflexi bacterium]|nr:type II toxin-antitoxin system VapC family toxin [Chloroflexota bacterium]